MFESVIDTTGCHFIKAKAFGPFPAIVSPWAENGNLTVYLKRQGGALTVVRRFQLDYPNYYQSITHPIALSTPRNIMHYKEDWELMFNNAQTYNQEALWRVVTAETGLAGASPALGGPLSSAAYDNSVPTSMDEDEWLQLGRAQSAGCKQTKPALDIKDPVDDDLNLNPSINTPDAECHIQAHSSFAGVQYIFNVQQFGKHSCLDDLDSNTAFPSNTSYREVPPAHGLFNMDDILGKLLGMAKGTWEKLSQVAVLGAEYDSPERQPHPKCLEGTRVDLLKLIHRLLDKREKSQIIWLHGTAGVGKSAVAFTVAERMKSLKITQNTKIETRLAGTFFFSRNSKERSTTGHFFATLAYQLVSNFPSVKNDVNKAIHENPAVLDSSKSLCDQMKVLFRQPLRHLQFRLRACPPLVFVIDALDECKPKTVADLISLLGEALHDPDLPVIHILLTSRLEEHIRKAIQKVHALVYEIPVNTSGEGISCTILLDGEDVDNDIYIFLQHSFTELQSCHPDFPQLAADKLTWLANRAGRHFIVASTMMKFVDDGYNDPLDRLELMLELTNELLPGTEVYELYNHILSTCSNPSRAYQHLSIVAALADPLPISQISKLLGLGQGSDVATILVQLQSFMNIPADGIHPHHIPYSLTRLSA
ncbi:uncharacterized protein F5147DRAFT_655156 [Suillus discolor]|uniref:NACHT domain-containing protein n=1 Tax=Suillus discolor TaxID=1912936 RepID=A0A9P7F1Z9_9AGAM|nr:uncharacterized protein F5147DRAFT_655156 [Suillus discolor]KAG2101831.1 hypothetical protein F5147DRAFT_655156 [Suillus discolor]